MKAFFVSVGFLVVLSVGLSCGYKIGINSGLRIKAQDAYMDGYAQACHMCDMQQSTKENDEVGALCMESENG